LEGTPFGAWLVPGIALLLLVAVPLLAATVVELRARRGAEVVSAVAGLIQVGWSAIELLFIHR
jgi:hypothetical protein